MQQTQTQNIHNPRLSTSSHSSLSAATNALLNGILPYPRYSQTSVTAPTLTSNLTANQLKELQKTNDQLKRAKWIKQASIVTGLTIILAIFLLIVIESGSRLVRNQSNLHLFGGNLTNITTNEYSFSSFRSFFTCIWIYNGLLCLNCFLVHSIAIQRRSRRGRTTAVFLRYYLIYLIVHDWKNLRFSSVRGRQQEKGSKNITFFFFSSTSKKMTEFSFLLFLFACLKPFANLDNVIDENLT